MREECLGWGVGWQCDSPLDWSGKFVRSSYSYSFMVCAGT